MYKTYFSLLSFLALVAAAPQPSSTSSADSAVESPYHQWSSNDSMIATVNKEYEAWGLGTTPIMNSIGFGFTLNAKGTLYVQYGKNRVMNGQVMTDQQVGNEPPSSIIFSPTYDYEPEMSDKEYTLFFADIGAVREEGGFGDNWLHWIQGNMTIEAIDPDGKDIAGRLIGGDPALEYATVEGPEGSGQHRYGFLLFEQERGFDYQVETISGSAQGEPMKQIWEKTGLGELVGASWFLWENGTAELDAYVPDMAAWPDAPSYSPVSGISVGPVETGSSTTEAEEAQTTRSAIDPARQKDEESSSSSGEQSMTTSLVDGPNGVYPTVIPVGSASRGSLTAGLGLLVALLALTLM